MAPVSGPLPFKPPSGEHGGQGGKPGLLPQTRPCCLLLAKSWCWGLSSRSHGILERTQLEDAGSQAFFLLCLVSCRKKCGSCRGEG